jgi:hypothetical protein
MNIVPLSPEEERDREDVGEWVESEEFPRSFPYTWVMLLARILGFCMNTYHAKLPFSAYLY